MKTVYQLTCSCGNTVEVEKTQAGGTVVCRCGISMEVPGLRELIQYPSQQRSSSSREITINDQISHRGNAYQRRAGIAIFFLVITLLFGGICFYFYNTCPTILPGFEEHADAFSVWCLWQYIRPGIETPLNPVEGALQEQIASSWRWIYLTAAISVISALCFIMTLAVPVKKYD